MKYFCFLFLIFIIGFISCKKDEGTIIDPNSNAKYEYYYVADTMRVTFDVSGITTSQPKLFTNPNFTSNGFFVKMNLQTISSGTFRIDIFKNDYDSVFFKTYNAVINTIDSGTSTPPINKFLITPANFTGKGVLTITKK